MGISTLPWPTPELQLRADRARDIRDAVLEHQAFDLILADERIIVLEADVAVYRQVLCAAFDALRDLTVTTDKLRATHQRVTDEYRRLREECFLDTGAAE